MDWIGGLTDVVGAVTAIVVAITALITLFALRARRSRSDDDKAPKSGKYSGGKHRSDTGRARRREHQQQLQYKKLRWATLKVHRPAPTQTPIYTRSEIYLIFMEALIATFT